MKRVKMALSLFLAILFTLLAFAGCGGSGGTDFSDDPDEKVTLRWVMPWYQQTDFAMVQEEINKLLPTLLRNTQLELVLDSAMGEKWSLWMSGKTSFDLAHAGYANDLQAEIMKNSYMDLTELVDKYAPTIKAEMDEYEVSYLTGTYNNKLYAVPNIQYHIKETPLLRITKKLQPYVDIDKIYNSAFASPKTTEDLYIALDEMLAKADAAREEGVGKVNVDIARMYGMLPKRGYIFIGGLDSNICYDPYAETPKIINFYETDEFKTFMKYANKWYRSGNIDKDVLTSVDPDISGGQIMIVDGGRNGFENGAKYIVDGNSIVISLNNPEFDVLGSHSIGSLYTYTTIPFTAAHPERAMQLMELLRTEKGAPLMNMICYGIEGVHYKKLSDTMIDPFDYDQQGTSGSKYGIANWLVGNMFNQYIVNPPYDETTVAYGRNYYDNYITKVKRTALFGFNFDIQPVKNQMSQILNINAEYEPQLAYGVLTDYEATYETMLERLKAGGLDKVLENFQKQADEYIAKNK